MADTIKEIAIACGVSEQAIRGWCRRNQVAKDERKGYILDDGIKACIYRHYKLGGAKDVAKAKGKHESNVSQENGTIELIKVQMQILKNELEIKNKQIERQAETIENLSSALAAAQQTAQAAQALHAGTIRQQLASGEAADEPEEAPAEKRQGWLHKIFSR